MHSDMLTPDFETTQNLDELHLKLEQINVKNGWNKPTPSLYPEPRQRYVPAHWRYADARAALHAAGRLVGTEWAERRNLILANPIEGNDYPTVTTMVAAYQMVKSGEKARSHRHTPNAMRIIMESTSPAYTIVSGVNVPMEPGDVLLTPNWHYHGHDNRSDTDAYWIDILDAPTVQLLGPMFFEHHPDAVEKTEKVDPDSSMRFAFRDYRPQLLAQPEAVPGVRMLGLGEGMVETFDRTAIGLAAGTVWKQPRKTASDIFVVVEGEGTSSVGGRQFAWARGDVIAVPSWIAQEHRAMQDAILIRVSDTPLLQALNWVREEK
ncbi:cupin [Advenella kashmirensis W13003]|uniref:Cupin n=1 Tax=Advenella kashmirensis W13003 TaxID=1424334 RepID=V8QTM5_9BURK|nr:cupin domain-containing protein [Advenella kashmirensis]ETF02693.1 cupin [Advenella kashmirensis W13003]